MSNNILSDEKKEEIIKAALNEYEVHGTRIAMNTVDMTVQAVLQSPEIQQLRKDRDALIDELKSLMHGYLNCLENGRDRIVFLGGDCDSIEVMEASDTNLRSARELLAAMEAKP